MRITWVVGLGLSWLLTGCLFLDGSYHADRITSFRVWQKGGTTKPLSCAIDQRHRVIEVPLQNWVDPSSLLVDFETRAPLVTCGEKEVRSGFSVLDLRCAQTLSVHANDSTVTEYTVRPVFAPVATNAVIPASWNTQTGEWEYKFANKDQPEYSFEVQANATKLSVDGGPSEVMERPYYWADTDATLKTRISGIGPHTIQVFTANGDRLDQTLRLSWKETTIGSISLPLKYNPALAHSIDGNVLKELQQVKFRVPVGTDVSNVVVELGHYDAAKLTVGDRLISSLVSLSLSSPVTLTLVGGDGTKTDWTLECELFQPSSSKELLDYAFYGPGSQTPGLWRPESSFRIRGVDADERAEVIDWVPSKTAPLVDFSPRQVFLEVYTSGQLVSVRNKQLFDGDSQGIYAPNNWLDLTTPITLTVEAEDGSTKNYTIGIRAP